MCVCGCKCSCDKKKMYSCLPKGGYNLKTQFIPTKVIYLKAFFIFIIIIKKLFEEKNCLIGFYLHKMNITCRKSFANKTLNQDFKNHLISFKSKIYFGTYTSLEVKTSQVHVFY